MKRSRVRVTTDPAVAAVFGNRDLVTYIFSILSFYDVALRASLVNHSWKEHAAAGPLWRHFCETVFPAAELTSTPYVIGINGLVRSTPQQIEAAKGGKEEFVANFRRRILCRGFFEEGERPVPPFSPARSQAVKDAEERLNFVCPETVARFFS